MTSSSDIAGDARVLCELALETVDSLKIKPNAAAVPPIDAVKSWILAQGCSSSFNLNNAKKIVSATAAKALYSLENRALMVSLSLTIDAPSDGSDFVAPCNSHSWPKSTWKACIEHVQPHTEHTPHNFISGEAIMSHYSDCSQYVELENELKQRLPHLAARFKNVPLVLYAMQGASSARMADVVQMCADCCGGSVEDAEAMRHIVKNLRETHLNDNVEEHTRQFVSVMRAVEFSPSVAHLITYNRAQWPVAKEGLNTGSSDEQSEIEQLLDTDKNVSYEGAVRTDHSVTLDHAADVSAKAFAQQVEFSPMHHLDDHRFLYVIGGTRNAASLFSSLFSDEPEHTQQSFTQYITGARGEPLHDDTVFPHMISSVFERPRSDAFMDAEHSTLMNEVNSFVRSVYGSIPSNDELLRERRIVMWLTANSRGDAARRLTEWCGITDSAQLNNLEAYLRNNKGPTPKAMHALRNIYFSGSAGA